MEGCVFCQIAEGHVGGAGVYQDDLTVAFNDLHPQAPVHILIIPRSHVASLSQADDEALLGHLLATARRIAGQKGLRDYRLVLNTGKEAGQSVFHLHLHLLAGRAMGWPPG